VDGTGTEQEPVEITRIHSAIPLHSLLYHRYFKASLIGLLLKLDLLFTAGLFSNWISHFVAARITFPRAIKDLTMRAVTPEVSEASATGVTQRIMLQSRSLTKHAILPSLGASGAIYSTVTITALAFPDTSVSLIFLPGLHAPIQYGVGGLVCLDVIGILRGWRMFDHYAHLAGAGFGALYWHYGPDLWDALRVATSSL
jgi:rhomboid-like protein